MDSSHSSARSSVFQNSVSSDVDESSIPSGSALNSLTEDIVAYEKESDETKAVKKLDALCTPESFVTHSNFDTPGGTVYYIPKVSADVLLVKGNVYDSVDDCVVAYMKYAAEAGFVVRRSCQKRLRNGDVKQKYLVCNRKGCPKGIHVDTLDLENSDKQKRNSNLHINGCKTRAMFNLDPRTRKFVLNVFDTIYNHELEREKFKYLSKRERQLTYLEQAFIVKVASVNIGATRAHHLLNGIKGSYLLLHGTMVDEVSKYNYKEFGDVVSFDATFKTNKYKMVFLPFTAIDNHRKCVTVVAGLLKNETTKSYIWLLKAFIKAFGNAPSIVVTDQDRAMRNAIEAECAGSKHRLCMWHITQKLPAKGRLMEEFKLENHKWLTKMFNIRSTWILAYFIYSQLCGLMRTTSRLENENSFFSHFTNSGSTLMNFMNCFEMAMEKQRHVQERMDHMTIDTVPKLKTFLKIECHASNVYTRSLFELVQKEICKDKAEEDDTVDLFFKKDGLYKNDVVENFANEETSIVDHCVHLLSKYEPRLGAFVEKIKLLKKDVEADCPNSPSKNKTDNLEQLVGVLKPAVVDVNNPSVGSTKGRQKLRTDHNKRTCSGRFEVQDEVAVQKEVCQEEVVVQKEVCQEEVVQEKVDLSEDEEELVEEDEDLIHK
ncbi:protein FAR1-related sequence 5 [Tanacetum coccineum]